MTPGTILPAGAALAAALFLAFDRLVRRGLAPARIPPDETPADLGLDYAEVAIPTANDKQLQGWLVGMEDGISRPAVVLLHGWGGNAATLLPLLQPLVDGGFAVLMFDARCHGRSDEDHFTSLPRFAEDLHHAVDWLYARHALAPGSIAVLGHSVGAGAALLVASQRDDLAAAISLSAFAHPAAMMKRFLAAHRVPYRPLGWAVLRYVERVIGHRFDDIAPQHTIARARCPVMLVHGADDRPGPVAHAPASHAARGDAAVALHVIAGSHDEFGNAAERAAASARVVDFLRAAMNAGRRCVR